MSEQPSDCRIPAEKSRAILEGIVEKIRRTGMRKTEALEELLTAMLEHHRPFTIAELGETPGLAGRDQATIYRLATKLRDIGVLRQLSLGERGSYFQLNLSDHHHDYLVCRSCQAVAEVPVDCVLGAMERKLEADHGWRDLTHSLSFQGLCPDCAPSSTGGGDQ